MKLVAVIFVFMSCTLLGCGFGIFALKNLPFPDETNPMTVPSLLLSYAPELLGTVGLALTFSGLFLFRRKSQIIAAALCGCGTGAIASYTFVFLLRHSYFPR